MTPRAACGVTPSQGVALASRPSRFRGALG